MDLAIKGLRVLVTAGAAGIGREITQAFVREGALVHVCDLSEAALADLRQSEPSVTTSICDVADRASVERMLDQALIELGGLDCLVNNAGIAGPTGRVDKIEPDAWARTLAVNLTGPYNCTGLAVPHLIESKNASIVNLSSVAGRLGFRLRTPYAASKWGVIGLTKSLSMELGEFGIRVNAVLPGLVEGERQTRVLTEKAEDRGISLEEMQALALAQVSIKAMVSPRQIADTIAFLASPLASTISGQAISICGDLQSLS